MANKALVRVSTVALVLFALSIPRAEAQQAREGETWEQTVQMTAMGMNMPERKDTVCRAKAAGPAEPQMPPDGDCKMTDVQTAGSRVSFKIACTKPQAMTGTGEMVYDGQNAYSGTMTMSAPQGTMVMKMAGRRLGAACDPGELVRRIEAQQTQAAAQTANIQRMQQQELVKACTESADALNVTMFTGATPLCADSAPLCKNFRTEAGFSKVDRPDGVMMKQVGDLCKVEPKAVRADLCTTALQKESLSFLSTSCVAESQVIAQRECAGRKFTSDINAKYQTFCASYFATTLQNGTAANSGSTTTTVPPTPTDVKGAAVDKAKKRIGGLFGR